MNAEQFLLKEWRKLPAEKQKQVIDFVFFLEFKLKEFERNIDRPDRQQEKIKNPEETMGDRQGERILSIRGLKT